MMLTHNQSHLAITCDGCGTTYTRAEGDRLPPGYYGNFTVVAPEVADSEWYGYYACQVNCVPGALSAMQATRDA